MGVVCHALFFGNWARNSTLSQWKHIHIPPLNDKVILDYAGAVAGTTLLSQKVVKQTIPNHTTYSHVQVYAIKTIVNRMQRSYEHKKF